jgi:hypothetical protein
LKENQELININELIVLAPSFEHCKKEIVAN